MMPRSRPLLLEVGRQFSDLLSHLLLLCRNDADAALYAVCLPYFWCNIMDRYPQFPLFYTVSFTISSKFLMVVGRYSIKQDNRATLLRDLLRFWILDSDIIHKLCNIYVLIQNFIFSFTYLTN